MTEPTHRTFPREPTVQDPNLADARVDPVPLAHNGPADISLWRVDIAFDASLEAAAFAPLSADERKRAQAFRRSEDALRFASVRVALRSLLAQQLKRAPGDIRFALDATHRPHLADSDAFDFNVSHAGAYGLIGLSDRRRVGVDIERQNTTFDWRSITALTLDASEAAWIDGLDADVRMETFYDAWVAKEALVKTTGVGISLGLQNLTVLPRDGDAVILRNRIPAGMHDLNAHWLTAPAGYAACLSWSTKPIAR